MKRLLVAFCLCLLVPVTANAAAKYLMRLGSIQAEDFYLHKMTNRMAELVKEKTNGEVEVKLFPSSVLGSERDMIEGMRMGSLESMLGYGGVLALYVPEFDVLNMPYVFENYAQIHKVLGGEIGKDLAERYFKATNGSVRIVWYLDHAFRQVFTSNKKIEKMADCKGVKIRSVESPIYIETFKAMGLAPTPMPFGEIYTAVQTHVVDGHEQEESGMVSMKFYEIEKFGAVTNHIYNPAPLHISELFLKKLPEATRKALLEAVVEAGMWWNEQEGLAEKEQVTARDWLIKEKGVVFTYPDIGEFKNALLPLQDQFAEKLGPATVEMLKRVREATAGVK
ncbi:MAG: TRAP transporter substrate-binding protein [Candidatus Accumulibacter sp.]|jgi:tripartite ATP-independent transporter DctP family solute receptor|nr:TRAP transporter substrate-binding protein [Accumulibacter sp.]